MTDRDAAQRQRHDALMGEQRPVADDFKQAADTRYFQGSGGFTLPVPGLKRLKRVVTKGGTELPTEDNPQVNEYPGDEPTASGEGRNWMRDEFAHVKLVVEAGQPVLKRHLWSNGTGKFPAADGFYVSGDWEDDKKDDKKDDKSPGPAPQEPGGAQRK